MELNIKRNPRNGGLYCNFEHNGKYYYADIAYLVDYNECMIFLCDEDYKVTDWLELYVNRDVVVTEDCLRRCVEEFIFGLKEEEGE